MQALYSDEGLDKDDTMYDPYNVTTRNFNRGKAPIPEVKILVPEGYRDVLSLDTSTQARLCNKLAGSDYCN